MDNLNHPLCNLCQSKKAKLLFSNYDRMLSLYESFDLLQCTECGLIFIHPQPTQELLSKHYDKDKYTVFTEIQSISNVRKFYTLLELVYYFVRYKRLPKIIKFISIILYPVKSIFRTTKLIENGNFLDVGCGNGYFLLIMKYLGMNIYGIEPGPFDKKLLFDYGLNIFNGNLNDAKYGSEFFDVITINHVLEHVNDPSGYLNELYRILKPGGYLIIAVPLSDSFAHKIFGKYWSQLDTPRHLYLFSKNNLIRYANRFNFRVIDIKYNSTPTYQILCSFIYILEAFFKTKLDRSIVYNLFLNLLLLPISSLLNVFHLGDQCEIILIKD